MKTWEENKGPYLKAGLLIRDLPILTNYTPTDSFKLFPYSVILTQACDIQSHYKVMKMQESNSVEVNRQFIANVLLCPAFDEHLFQKGEHFSKQLKVKIKELNSGEWNPIKQNKNIRYQFINSDKPNIIPNLVIDFKQYFTVTFSYLETIYNAHVEESYILNHFQLLNLSDRLAHYIQRVAIPELNVGTDLEQDI